MRSSAFIVGNASRCVSPAHAAYPDKSCCTGPSSDPTPRSAHPYAKLQRIVGELLDVDIGAEHHETTDDLEPAWYKVKGYLEQQGILVVPKTYLPRDPKAFKYAVDSALDSSLGDTDLFVQLLSLVPGRKPDDPDGILDGAATYGLFQFARARDAGC